MFTDRADAGRQLASLLKQKEYEQAIVLAIPHGGAEVGWQIASICDLPFSLIIVRKLPLPDNPESGFGAMAEDGSLFMHPQAQRWVTPEEQLRIVEEQEKEIRRRIDALRKGQPLPDLRGRHIILVDDGIAMGSSAHVAVKCCRHLGARRITVAAPVASAAAVTRIQADADDIVVPLMPPYFSAVAEAYRQWYDVPQSEVLEILKRAEERGHLLTTEQAQPTSSALTGKETSS